MKKSLNRLILTLVLCSVTFSCDNDEPTVEQHTEEFAKTDLIDFSKLQSEDISFDQLLTKLNNPTLDKGILSKIDFGINSNDDITNRVVDTLLIVDTNTLFFAQYDNYNYTTFPIIEDLDNDSFRNLIIENIDGDHPVARIITYTPDETWLYSDHTLTEYAGEATMESFSGEWQVSTQRSQYCHITTTTNWGCDYQWNSGHYPGYPGCYGGNIITGYTTTEDCYDFTGGEGSGSGSGGGDGEGSGGSGNGSSDGDDLPIITKPVERCLQSDVDPAICECMADGSTMQECLEEEQAEFPCETLNALTSSPTYNEPNPFTATNSTFNPTGKNTRIRLAINNISNDFSPHGESYYGLYNRGNYPAYGPYAHFYNNEANNRFKQRPVQWQFGTIHTHPTDNRYPQIFSPDDMFGLLSIRNT